MNKSEKTRLIVLIFNNLLLAMTISLRIFTAGSSISKIKFIINIIVIIINIAIILASIIYFIIKSRKEQRK